MLRFSRVVSLIACAALSAAPGFAFAAGGISFVPIGPTHMGHPFPGSGKVNAVAVDPTNAKVIYVASGRGTGLESYSSAGIYRTSDGGATWQTADAGLLDPAGFISSTINALWIDPAHPKVLLASSEYDGLFRSTDGAASWKNVARVGRSTEFASYGGALYAATAGGLLESTDDGSTWTVSLAANAQRQPSALGAYQGSAGSAFVAGMTDGSIYAFSGKTWTKTAQLPFFWRYRISGNTPEIHQLAVDPFRPTTVYASTNDGLWDQNLYGSTDGGHTWKGILKKQYEQLGLGTQAIAFSRVHPHRLYVGLDGLNIFVAGDGTPNPKVYRAARLQVVDIRNIWTIANGKDDACWYASDQGLDYDPSCSAFSLHHHDTVVTGPLATGLVRHFAISPDGRTIVASLQDYSSFATYDGGTTWHVKPALYEDGFNEINPADPRKCYVLDDIGFHASTDGCRTFAAPSGPSSSFSGDRLFSNPIAFDPGNPNRVYLVGLNHKGNRYIGEIVTTTDGGKTLVGVPGHFNTPGSIQVDRTNGKHIVVSDYGPGNYYSNVSVTFDGGAHWKRSAGVPVPAFGFWYSMTISPVDGRTVLAMSVDSNDDAYVLRSTDGGLSFKRVALLAKTPAIGHIDADLAPIVEPRAYVYTPAREIRFNDGVTTGTPYVVATTLRGAFLSTNLGTTWQRIDASTIAHGFWSVRWFRGYLYLATDGQGIVRSTAPVQP